MADKFIKIPGKNKYRTQLLTKLYQCSVLSQLENDVYLFSLLSSPGLKATVSFSDNICLSFVSLLFVNFSHLGLLRLKHLANFK